MNHKTKPGTPGNRPNPVKANQEKPLGKKTAAASYLAVIVGGATLGIAVATGIAAHGSASGSGPKVAAASDASAIIRSDAAVVPSSQIGAPETNVQGRDVETTAAIGPVDEPIMSQVDAPDPAPERFAMLANTGKASEPPVAVPEPEITSDLPLPVPEERSTGELQPAAPDPAPEVDIALTEAEVVAMEEKLSAEGNAYFQLAPERNDVFEVVAPSAGLVLPRAWTNQWVNMRAGPDNDAETVTIVPGGKEIRAEADCAHWCRVNVDGRDGYIYKSFIRRQ